MSQAQRMLKFMKKIQLESGESSDNYFPQTGKVTKVVDKDLWNDIESIWPNKNQEE